MRVSLKQHVVQGGDSCHELGRMGSCFYSKTAPVERVLLGEPVEFQGKYSRQPPDPLWHLLIMGTS